MALPASGAISWSDIRDEFVQSGAFALTQCYRSNGSSVMPFTAGTTGIPASGTISASNFQGKSGYGTFQTFVAGSMIAIDKNNLSVDRPGFDLNVGSSGGSGNGTIKIGGNNKRAMVSRIAWVPSASYDPTQPLDIYFNQAGNINTIAANKYDSGDLNLSNANGAVSGSFLNGKTITIYNGTGTGGSVVLTSVISVNAGQQNLDSTSSNQTQYHAASNQTGRFGVSCTYESATLTTGNTYSFTIA
jgi:hypothetical protein